MTDELTAKNDQITIPGYELDDQLWESPRSKVWRGRRTSDQKAVIVKIVNEDQPSPTRLARFRHEYDLTCRFQGDGVPRPLTLEGLGRGAMLVLADSGGTACNKLLAAEGTFTALEATRIALGVARILARIHKEGVIHKDVNPSNIVRNRTTDDVELIDFELASELSHEDVGVAHPGNLAGTLAYIAPEQTGRMNRDVDYRADFYGLGASLFECLTGQPPFTAEDTLALVHSHIAVAPPAVADLAPAVPDQLGRIVARLLAKTPEARYQSASGLAEDLAACYDALAAGMPVPAFAPGAHDIPQTLQIPEKLYGREDAVATLTEGLERAAAGGRGAAMVTGEPGIGKSALVGELYKPVTAHGGYLLAGKFDQLQRDRPYSALLQAIDDLMRQILAASEAELAAWRVTIEGALGPNGGVLTQLIPDLVQIIGEQPAPAELDPEAARNRLNDTLSRFVGAVVGPDHPVVLFLDDLHWADTGSLSLLRSLLLDPDLGYLYVVGAYRENAVDDAHPLARLLADLAARQVSVATCHLAGLGEADVARLIADTLNTSPDACAELARQAQTKTLGNPFFLERLLARWAEEGLLWPDAAAGRWRWDSAGIAGSAVADNVGALMAEKLHSLPAATQIVLAQAAILGSYIDLADLAIIVQDDPVTVLNHLWPALSADLIRPIDEDYKSVAERGHSGHAKLRFRHDNIQQAALDLLDPDAYRETQLKAGRLLLQNIAEPQTDERLFEALGHLNAVTDLLAGPGERETVIRLNLMAGERAQRAAAHGPAERFLAAGFALLGDAAWSEAPQLAHTFTQARAESAYVLGEMAQMRALTDTILAQVDDPVATARARQLRIQAHVIDGSPGAGVDEGLASLAALGVKLPSHPGKGAVLADFAKTRRLLNGLDHDAQLRRDEMVDPHYRAIMDLLASLNAPAYIARPNLVALVVFRHVRLSIQVGNHPSSPLAFASYATLLMSLGYHVREADRLARLAETLVNELGAERYRSATDLIVAFFVDGWQADIATIADRLVTVYEEGLRAGDIEYAAFAVHSRTALLRMTGKPLGQLEAEMAQDARRVQKTGQRVSEELIAQHRQHIHQMYHPLSEPAELNGPYAFGADAAETLCRQGNYNALVAKAQLKALCGYHYDGLAGLAWWLEILAAYLPSIQGAPNFANGLAYYVAISAARAAEGYAPADRATQRRLRRRLGRLDSLIGKIGNPGCYTRFVELARGEVRRLEGRYDAALAAFEAAVASAEASGYQHEAGLARERAARLYQARGLPHLAKAFLQDALGNYAQWEAHGKVAYLHRRYPALGMAPGGAEAHGSRTTASATSRISRTETSQGDQDLDLEAVVRAAQTISQEIRPARLAATLMEVVGQTAGATHGCLMLGDHASRLATQALLDTDRSPSVTVLVEHPGPAPELADVVPLAAVRYALRRRALVVADNPESDQAYQNDPYIAAFRPQSILCLPLVNQGRVTGVLYVEHRYSAGAFPRDRTTTLELLSAQMAVSLENAQLYSDMEAQVAARTRELEALARTDYLTGLANRRQVMTALAAELERSRRYSHTVAVLLIDIDHFKAINDSYGHDAGDEVLKAVAGYLQEALRLSDTVGRFGGEELLVVLPETGQEEARQVADRLRRELPASLPERLPATLANAVTATISIGVAAVQPDGDTRSDDLIQAADTNCYQAKSAGRNCVVA